MALHYHPMVLTFYCVWLAILLFIYTPIIIYYCKQLWHLNQTIPSFHKRYPKYVIIYSMSILFHMLVVRTIADISHITNVEFFSDTVRLTLYNTIHGVYMMAVTRAWLLYVEYTRGNHLMRLSWQQLIDAKADHIHIPWTLKYPLLSNIKFVTVIGLIYWIIFVVAISYSFNLNHHMFTYSLFYVLLSIFFLFFVYQIRKCRDEFFIHLELRYIGIVFVIMIPIRFVIYKKFENCPQELAIISTVFLDICMMIICLISTQFVVYKYRMNEILSSSVLPDSDNLNEYNQIELECILQIKDGFDLFANHLVKEFSIEHLIFLFEIMQLKYEVIDNGILHCNDNKDIDDNKDDDNKDIDDKDIDDKDIDIGIMFKCGEFYMKNIKRNKLHFEITNNITFYEKFVFILYHYIEADAEYAINISSKIRNKILIQTKDIMLNYKYMMKQKTTSVFMKSMSLRSGKIKIMPKLSENNNNNELQRESVSFVIDIENEKEKIMAFLKLMDDAIESVLRLLSSDSYHRFIQTKSFKKLIESNPNLPTTKR